jgi:hypothetical protein
MSDSGGEEWMRKPSRGGKLVMASLNVYFVYMKREQEIMYTYGELIKSCRGQPVCCLPSVSE